MILKIVGFGHPALRAKNEEITPDFPNLQELVDNMFETMYGANGVGLAGPQVAVNYRIFVVDGEPMQDMEEEGGESMEGFKKVFINAKILKEEGDTWAFEEGCLSIPDVREDVARKGQITIRYMDEHFVEHEETYTGVKARIIQHEYDHIEGILFTDLISPLRRRMVKKRLNRISTGDIAAHYPMKFKRT
ncbi:MAG: peptide deformylase [Bacteroidia bacterium]